MFNLPGKVCFPPFQLHTNVTGGETKMEAEQVRCFRTNRSAVLKPERRHVGGKRTLDQQAEGILSDCLGVTVA